MHISSTTLILVYSNVPNAHYMNLHWANVFDWHPSRDLYSERLHGARGLITCGSTVETAMRDNVSTTKQTQRPGHSAEERMQ